MSMKWILWANTIGELVIAIGVFSVRPRSFLKLKRGVMFSQH